MTLFKMYTTQINRAVAVLLSCLVVFTLLTAGPVYAAKGQDLLKQSIYEATYLLEDAIESSMDNAEKEVKAKIVERKYDYYSTMETFYRCDNPYIDADYLELLAAYLVAKEHVDTLIDSSLYNLPFIKESVITTFSWEYVPKAVDRYIEDDKGSYYISGKMYISEPSEITTYEQDEDGSYQPSGTREIQLEKEFTKYGEVRLKGIGAEGILAYYGLDAKTFMDEVKKKKSQFETIVSGTGLKQSMFLSSSKADLLDSKTIAYIESLLKDEELELSRKYLIDSAVSLVGKVPYEWGGKASGAGYDPTWWTIDKTGRQKGLDCSGFVQWAFMTAGFEKSLYDGMISTDTILSHTETIEASKLRPGDMGLFNNGHTINHVGIYLGDGMWVHWSSAKNTVVVEKTNIFKIYKRMPEGEGSGFTGIPVLSEDILKKEFPKDTAGMEKEDAPNQESTDILAYRTDCDFTDYEIFLVAQLAYNEAAGEGLNGWAAVAEVVLNRFNSDKFPNTIEGVVYEEGQFADSDRIQEREPSDELITVVKEVLTGNMQVLGDSSVMFFRNAGGLTEDWGSHAYFDTINSHQFYRY